LISDGSSTTSEEEVSVDTPDDNNSGSVALKNDFIPVEQGFISEEVQEEGGLLEKNKETRKAALAPVYQVRVNSVIYNYVLDLQVIASLSAFVVKPKMQILYTGVEYVLNEKGWMVWSRSANRFRVAYTGESEILDANISISSDLSLSLVYRVRFKFVA